MSKLNSWKIQVLVSSNIFPLTYNNKSDNLLNNAEWTMICLKYI